MTHKYESKDWRDYKMDWHDPHRVLEPLENEIDVVGGALNVLVQAGILPHSNYDNGKLLAYREAVAERFDIPWTAISHRMQRLIYAINAIHRPHVMVAVGIFCGNTFSSNAGAAMGPGAVYEAERLVGLEIRTEEADRARRNVATIDAEGKVDILGEDGIPWLENFEGTVDLFYLDADGPKGKGKSIYLDLAEAAERVLKPGSLVLAHNSVNAAKQLADYLAHMRDSSNFKVSANMVVDNQGLEVSIR